MDPTISAALYAGTRARVTDAVRTLGPADLDRIVPACPAWTVHNLVSHLAGVAADFVAGNLDGAPEPPWTAVQVDARRDLPLSAILAEWAATDLESTIATSDHPLVSNLWADAGTHEADLSAILPIPRPPTSLQLAAVRWILDEPGALTLHTEHGTWALAGDGPPAEATTSTYELFRALMGRRHPSQIRAWTWSEPSAAGYWSHELPRLPEPAQPQTD
ncbi:hypothetical protein HPO96_33880 [Kribbella sandramycini]|uniref:Mycothiol-dependent maleylpyruvate isomerase metal-binding domain-containing protein n=1 Tax=Kribbella sandramycini TaxID=60450 RepID=A0A7Y4L6E0_9ACTN|nr:maleylpyruvate isomerase N-terminal domain-containing protein [Kribbella sandramycini]MBB6570388.1 hypothetical protein [Kribbella sandramycini]NOL45250.1 hypothetical protein [Kribbella sandramycini]